MSFEKELLIIINSTAWSIQHCSQDNRSQCSANHNALCLFSATMSTVQECKLCWEIILWSRCLSAADTSFPGKANSSVWKWEPAQGIHASSLQRSGCSAAPPCIHNHCTRQLTFRWRYVLPIIAATMEYGCTGDCAFEIVPAINYWCNMTLMLASKLHKLFQSNLFWGIAISSVRFDQAR